MASRTTGFTIFVTRWRRAGSPSGQSNASVVVVDVTTRKLVVEIEV